MQSFKLWEKLKLKILIGICSKRKNFNFKNLLKLRISPQADLLLLSEAREIYSGSNRLMFLKKYLKNSLRIQKQSPTLKKSL